MNPTVGDLIDYLQQVPKDTLVVWDEDDIEEPCEFISLSFVLRELQEKK